MAVPSPALIKLKPVALPLLVKLNEVAAVNDDRVKSILRFSVVTIECPES